MSTKGSESNVRVGIDDSVSLVARDIVGMAAFGAALFGFSLSWFQKSIAK